MWSILYLIIISHHIPLDFIAQYFYWAAQPIVATLLEVLAETDREALGMEQNDQDREVLGAIKLGLAEEGSSLVMAWGQALALATAIKALRQWPSIRPQ